MKIRTLMMAGALLFGALTAQATGSALADTEVVPFPTQVPQVLPGREYQVTIPTPQVVRMTSTPALGKSTVRDIATPVNGSSRIYVICTLASFEGVLAWMLPGTYNFHQPAYVSGPSSLFLQPVPGEMNFSNFQVQEEEGGLEITWTHPPYMQECEPGRGGPGISWYRNGYQVGSGGAEKPTSTGYFIDSLTVGIKYKVELTWGADTPYGDAFTLIGGTPLVGYGTPRIPSVLLMQAPRVVPRNQPFPVEVLLEDRKGRPIANERVTLTYQPLAGKAAATTAGPSGKMLKTVKTNRKGVASAKVKLKKTGRIVATFNDSGKHAATLKTKKIKVKKGR